MPIHPNHPQSEPIAAKGSVLGSGRGLENIPLICGPCLLLLSNRNWLLFWRAKCACLEATIRGFARCPALGVFKRSFLFISHSLHPLVLEGCSVVIWLVHQAGQLKCLLQCTGRLGCARNCENSGSACAKVKSVARDNTYHKRPQHITVMIYPYQMCLLPTNMR